ncbi:cell filamentation protein Fic [Rhodococcus hoagii]|nr:cell filamentation protein Fic [Prescottella equi]
MSKPRGFSQEWVDYFIPETVSYDPQTGWPNLDDAVMRNLIAVDLGFEHGLPDQTIVDRLEVASSIKRLHELERNPIPGNYDLAHMQRIHHHLFQDVYPWAGEIRTAPRDWPMTKLGPNVKAHLAGEPNPPEVPHSYFAAKEIVPIAGRELDRIAAKDNLRGLDRDQFVDELTTVWARVNYVHPFREGNTRTQFAFFRQLAAEAGYELDTERFRDAVSARALTTPSPVTYARSSSGAGSSSSRPAKRRSYGKLSTKEYGRHPRPMQERICPSARSSNEATT